MSEDYQFFVKKIKYKDDVEVSQDINDNYTLEGPISDMVNSQEEDSIESPTSSDNSQDPISQDKSDEKGLELSDNAKQVLEVLGGNTLMEVANHSSLFDITTEYPDEYMEFRSDALTVYYFGDKKYEEVVDIFFAISQGLPFTLNKNNIFGDTSFFINLNPEFNDELVRIVFQHKKEVFGLKLKKDRYNAVKKSLETLKK